MQGPLFGAEFHLKKCTLAGPKSLSPARHATQSPQIGECAENKSSETFPNKPPLAPLSTGTTAANIMRVIEKAAYLSARRHPRPHPPGSLKQSRRAPLFLRFNSNSVSSRAHQDERVSVVGSSLTDVGEGDPLVTPRADIKFE